MVVSDRKRVLSLRFPGTLALVGMSSLVITLLSGCKKENQVKPVQPPAPVTVATVVRKDVPIQIKVIGSVQPVSTVAIKSNINGEVVKVNFKEGQDVKKGAVLFVIDPRPYETAIKLAEANMARDEAAARQARANLAKDTAQARNAEVETNRYARLTTQGIVSQEQSESVRTTFESMDASVKADRAAIENAEALINADRQAVANAKIQLGYCTITAPMDGRAGSLSAYQGTIIKANDTTSMVVLNQTAPIYVTFSVPEQFLADVKKYMATGQLKVQATPKDGSTPSEGVLTFVDNAVDQTTGTIQLKASFVNKERSLWPGQFANVVLTVSTQQDALIAPSQAIQSGQQGEFVFVVKPDMTVESRSVVLGKPVDTSIIIVKGVEAGERVVTDGQLRLVPGARVEIKESLASAAPLDGK